MIKFIIFWVLIIIELFFIAGYTIYIISLIYSSLKGSFFVPTSNRQLNQIFNKIDFNHKKIFIDLGSGDGRVVRYIAKQFPKIQAIGLEVNPLLIFLSRTIAKMKKIKNCQFYKVDLVHQPIPKADIVYLFLMPKLIDLISPKLKKLLDSNSLVISHGFQIRLLKRYLVKVINDKPFATYYYNKIN